jgi:VWFA-related protein
LALLVGCSVAAAAQDGPVFRSNTNLVVVPVTVIDRTGRFVHGLTADQFEIAEGPARRTIVHFSAEPVPVSLAILLDISGSMTESPSARAADDARWADTRRALELLLTRFTAADEVLFAAFSDKVAAAPWTNDYAAVLRGFDLLQPGGGTALLDAIRIISPAFQRARYQRKVLLVISDGNDISLPAAGVVFPYESDAPAALGRFDVTRQTRRQKLIDSTKVDVRHSGAMLYAIGIGTRRGVPVDAGLLKELTNESGGYVEPLRNPSEIPAAVGRICDDLQSQYLLAFEPGHADGSYHAIQVKTKDTRLRVRARAGYVAQSAAAK